MNRDKLTKLQTYIAALLAAQAVADEPEPEQPEEIDLDAWKVSQRNRILAGAGDKAALLGTLSTEPTVDAVELAELGLDSKVAASLVTERDRVRSVAVALTAPKEVAK